MLAGERNRSEIYCIGVHFIRYDYQHVPPLNISARVQADHVSLDAPSSAHVSPDSSLTFVHDSSLMCISLHRGLTGLCDKL